MLSYFPDRLFVDRYGAASLVRRLLVEEASRHRVAYFFNFALMGVVSACTALTAYLIGHVVNEIYRSQNFVTLLALSLITIAIFAAKGFSSYWQSILLAQIGNDVLARSQNRLVDKILCENLGYFADRPSSVVMAELDLCTRCVTSVLMTLTTAVGRDALSLVGLCVVMVFQEPFVSLIALVGIPAMMWSARLLNRRMRLNELDQIKGSALIIETVQECLQGLRVVKAFGLENEMRRRIEASTEHAKKMANAISSLSNRTGPLMETLGGIVVALVFLYGGYRVIVAGTPPGTFVSFIAAFLLAYEPAKRLTRLHVELGIKLAGVRQFYETLDAPATESDDFTLPALTVTGGKIEFDQVNFSYQPGRDALRRFTLVAEPDRVTALVGPSGGGKSTVFNLLLRFYDPDGGRIMIDRQDIAMVSRASLRRQIAYVGQDIYLFRGTIRENIAYGNLNASSDQIVAAAKSAQAHDFVLSLPSGYDTEVGEHGLQLSTGQRQRIAIARALLKDAPIVLLDEPTSSLDSESELLVKQALSKLCAGRTTLIIAHRLNTIADADVICVVENGTVVELGRHEQMLLRDGGRYASLYRLLREQPMPADERAHAISH